MIGLLVLVIVAVIIIAMVIRSKKSNVGDFEEKLKPIMLKYVGIFTNAETSNEKKCEQIKNILAELDQLKKEFPSYDKIIEDTIIKKTKEEANAALKCNF